MEPVNFVKVWGCKCTLCNPSSAPEEYAIIDFCLSKSYYHKFQQEWHKPFDFDKLRRSILYIPLWQSDKPWTSYTYKLTVITSARILIRILIKLGASYDPILDKAIRSVCACEPDAHLTGVLCGHTLCETISGSKGTWFRFFLGSFKKVYQKSCQFFSCFAKFCNFLDCVDFYAFYVTMHWKVWNSILNTSELITAKLFPLLIYMKVLKYITYIFDKRKK